MNIDNTHATSGAIEIFSADCPLCQDAVEVIKETVAPCGCTVRERPWEEGPRRIRLGEGGAYPIPSIAVGGTVVFDGCPDLADVQWLRRSLRRDESVARGRSLTFTFVGHHRQMTF